MSKVKCRVCKTEEDINNSEALSKWEMQHLHFGDGEIQFMTCPKCKKLSPMKYLEVITEDDHA